MATTLSNPLASICLKIICGWVNVVRKGKGGKIDEQGTPWTRLPAWEINDQLAREFHLEVNIRRVYRALKELEKAGLICRKQRCSYRRDYWYTLTAEAQSQVSGPEVRRQAGGDQSRSAEVRSWARTTRGHQLGAIFRDSCYPQASKSSDTARHMQVTQASNINLNTQFSKSIYPSSVLGGVSEGKLGQGLRREKKDRQRKKGDVNLANNSLPTIPPGSEPDRQCRENLKRQAKIEGDGQGRQRARAEYRAAGQQAAATPATGTGGWISEEVKQLQKRFAEALKAQHSASTSSSQPQVPVEKDAEMPPESPGTGSKTPSGTTYPPVQQQWPSKGFKGVSPAACKPHFVERPERLVRIDELGRRVKEVWVSGFRYLVVD